MHGIVACRIQGMPDPASRGTYEFTRPGAAHLDVSGWTAAATPRGVVLVWANAEYVAYC